MQTITESDIMDTQLWHEDQVNRPTNRYNITVLAYYFIVPVLSVPYFVDAQVTWMRLVTGCGRHWVTKKIILLKLLQVSRLRQNMKAMVGLGDLLQNLALRWFAKVLVLDGVLLVEEKWMLVSIKVNKLRAHLLKFLSTREPLYLAQQLWNRSVWGHVGKLERITAILFLLLVAWNHRSGPAEQQLSRWTTISGVLAMAWHMTRTIHGGRASNLGLIPVMAMGGHSTARKILWPTPGSQSAAQCKAMAEADRFQILLAGKLASMDSFIHAWPLPIAFGSFSVKCVHVVFRCFEASLHVVPIWSLSSILLSWFQVSLRFLLLWQLLYAVLPVVNFLFCISLNDW